MNGPDFRLELDLLIVFRKDHDLAFFNYLRRAVIFSVISICAFDFHKL